MSSQSLEGLGEGRLIAYLINMWGGQAVFSRSRIFAPCNRELRWRGDRIMVISLKHSPCTQNFSAPSLSKIISDCALEKQEHTGSRISENGCILRRNHCFVSWLVTCNPERKKEHLEGG